MLIEVFVCKFQKYLLRKKGGCPSPLCYLPVKRTKITPNCVSVKKTKLLLTGSDWESLF